MSKLSIKKIKEFVTSSKKAIIIQSQLEFDMLKNCLLSTNHDHDLSLPFTDMNHYVIYKRLSEMAVFPLQATHSTVDYALSNENGVEAKYLREFYSINHLTNNQCRNVLE